MTSHLSHFTLLHSFGTSFLFFLTPLSHSSFSSTFSLHFLTLALSLLCYSKFSIYSLLFPHSTFSFSFSSPLFYSIFFPYFQSQLSYFIFSLNFLTLLFHFPFSFSLSLLLSTTCSPPLHTAITYFALSLHFLILFLYLLSLFFVSLSLYFLLNFFTIRTLSIISFLSSFSHHFAPLLLSLHFLFLYVTTFSLHFSFDLPLSCSTSHSIYLLNFFFSPK